MSIASWKKKNQIQNLTSDVALNYKMKQYLSLLIFRMFVCVFVLNLVL